MVRKKCFICDAPLPEDEESGERRVICSRCEEDEHAFDLYRMKFAKLMERL